MKIEINQSMKHYPVSYTVNLKNAATGIPIASVYLPPAEVERKNISAGIKAITSSLQQHIDAVADTKNESYEYSTEELKPLYRMVLERVGNEKELDAVLKELPTRHFGENQTSLLQQIERDKEEGIENGR